MDSLANTIFKIQEFLHLMEVACTISMGNCKGDERVYLFWNCSSLVKRKSSSVIVSWNALPLGNFKLNTDALVVGDKALGNNCMKNLREYKDGIGIEI